jgi:2-polyprenyl-3-methyl-5-hydroxy-6-metoxy-1,4-benzoquinol methylase
MSFTIDQVVEHWDHTSQSGYEEFNAKTVSYGRRFTDAIDMIETSSEADIPEAGRLIDVGCGTGNGLLIFHERFGISGVGVDVSNGMLDIARAKMVGKSLPIELHQLDGESLPFDDNMFDAGISFEVLEHTPQPAHLLSELARVVKPGGTVVVSTPNTLWEPVHWFAAKTGLHHSEGPHRDVSRREILEGLEIAGLRVVEERTTVLVPAGPQTLVRLGQAIEHALPTGVLRVIALRRLFLCVCDKSASG